MNGPGISLFQGSDLKLNDSFQRAEEEELAEENRKRNAEVQDLCAGGFDDFSDDDDDSSLASFQRENSDHESSLPNLNYDPYVFNFQKASFAHQPRREPNLETIHEKHNESRDSMKGDNDGKSERIVNDDSGRHYTHCVQNGFNNDRDVDLVESYKKSEGGSYQELKVLYEVRLREVERLRRDVDAERDAKEEAVHRLSLCQSENSRILRELSECKEAASKSTIRTQELEDTVNKLKKEILDLEKFREKDKEEVAIAHQQVICLEQKIAALERCDISTTRLKQTDAFIESLTTKHQKELMVLQNKVDSVTSKLEQKDLECRGLEDKLEELERKRAALVLEKCDGASRQESALQDLLTRSKEECLGLQREVVALQTECTELKSDLAQYESVAKLRLCLGSSSDESEEVGASQLTRTRSASHLPRTPLSLHHQDLINNLKDELRRALVGKGAKRHEINKLREQVRSKEVQMQEMKERERVYLSQVDSLKADITKIVGQMSEASNNDKSVALEQMRSEIDRLAHSNQQHIDTIDSLNREIQRLNSTLNKGSTDVGLRERELAQLKTNTDRLLADNDADWRTKLEVVMRERDEIKQLYMDLRKNNGRLSDQLETQKQRLTELAKERDRILALLKEKDSTIESLKEENIKFKVENEMNRDGRSGSKDRETIKALEREVRLLKTELMELPKKHIDELEFLKKEQEAAKLRLLELDKRLRNEFQNEMRTIVDERDQLKEQLEVNRSMSNQNIKELKEVSVNTDATNQSELNDLKRLVEGMKNSNGPSLDQYYRDKLTDELNDLEQRLISEHKEELVATENRVKTVFTEYYANRIEDLKKEFTTELNSIIETEHKKISELMELLKVKDEQIQRFKSTDLSDRVVSLQAKIEEDHIRYNRLTKEWSDKVEKLEKKISDDENKIYFLNQCLKSERKDVQKYKCKFDQVKKKIPQEKLDNLLKLKRDLENMRVVHDLDGKELNEKVKNIETEFREKEKLLRKQFNFS